MTFVEGEQNHPYSQFIECYLSAFSISMGGDVGLFKDLGVFVCLENPNIVVPQDYSEVEKRIQKEAAEVVHLNLEKTNAHFRMGSLLKRTSSDHPTIVDIHAKANENLENFERNTIADEFNNTLEKSYKFFVQGLAEAKKFAQNESEKNKEYLRLTQRLFRHLFERDVHFLLSGNALRNKDKVNDKDLWYSYIVDLAVCKRKFPGPYSGLVQRMQEQDIFGKKVLDLVNKYALGKTRMEFLSSLASTKEEAKKLFRIIKIYIDHHSNEAQGIYEDQRVGELEELIREIDSEFLISKEKTKRDDE